MAQLIFNFGTMRSGKSAHLIAAAMNYWTKGDHILVVKPDTDTRDGNKIKTRLGMEIDCQLIPNEYGIVTKMVENMETDGKIVEAILVDEAQFLNEEVVIELSKLADDGYPVLCWGLKTNFKTQLFEGSRVLLELADKIQEVKTVCQFCGKKAILNLRTIDGIPADEKSPIISVGDEEYIQVCRDHYFRFYQGEPIPKINSLIE